ncbi:MAG: ATP-binding protein [Rickettsiales bacterium]|nr:ATP-binding protein [Rickettsiales bacterium]
MLESMAEAVRQAPESVRSKQTCCSTEFVVRSLAEIETITPFLSHLHPDAKRAELGIYELLINALEHGNMGVGYEEKTRLLRSGAWYDTLRALDSKHTPNCKSILIELSFSYNSITLAIEDEGDGFDWQPYLSFDPARIAHIHGRGIAIANHLSFDMLRYEGAGNRVVVTTQL